MRRRLAILAFASFVCALPGTGAQGATPVDVSIDDHASISVEPLPALPPTHVDVPLPAPVPELVAPITQNLPRGTSGAVSPANPSGTPAAAPRSQATPVAPAASGPRRASEARRTATPGVKRGTKKLGNGRSSLPRRKSPRSTPGAASHSAASPGRAGRDEQRTADEASPGIVATVVGVLPGWVRVLIGALGVLALLFGLTWTVNHLRAARLRRQSRELLDDAELFERTLTPNTPGRLGPLVFSVAGERAEGASGGGSFQDVFSLGANRTGIVLGQVSASTGSPLAQATLIRHRLRAHLELGLPPRSALRRAGELRDQERDGGFVSATVAIYDAGRGALTYSCAGHPTPLVFGQAADALAPVPHFSPPLGAGAGYGVRQTEISLPQGSTACIYSDGVHRLPESAGAIETAAASLLADQEEPDADALLSCIRPEAKPLASDIVVCLLRTAIGACAPTRHVEELVLAPDDATASHCFLLGCGLPPREAADVAGAATNRARATGQALLRVSWGAEGPQTEVVAYRSDSEWPARRPAKAVAVS